MREISEGNSKFDSEIEEVNTFVKELKKKFDKVNSEKRYQKPMYQ